jgi:DNA-binding beta-propeller fold protein YncE
VGLCARIGLVALAGLAVWAWLAGPASVAVSSDGRNVYIASAEGGGAIAAFARDSMTGALRQLPGRAGCVNRRGRACCARGRALSVPMSVAVSRDGRNLYVASLLSDGVAVFARDPVTGALRQLPGRRGCVSRRGREGCARGRALETPESVTVRPDDRNVYVASTVSRHTSGNSSRDAVSVFARDSMTGALRQLRGRAGCVSFTAPEGCARGRALEFPVSVAVGPDVSSVYIASFSSNAVGVFARSPE